MRPTENNKKCNKSCIEKNKLHMILCGRKKRQLLAAFTSLSLSLMMIVVNNKT